MAKYVIIGNSAAAIGCVEGIRSVDKKGDIVLIASEKHHTYSRPLISYLLYGKTDEQRMKYRPDSFYKDNKVTKKLGVTVTSVDGKKKTVTTDKGETISFDKLLVATGSNPFVPPMKGLDEVKNRFSFMTLDDAKALGKAINRDSKVLVVGAGLIGLKCVEGILDRVASVTVVDLANRILPSILDEDGSETVKTYLEKKGVRFYLSDSVAEFKASTASLQSGAELDYDVAVIAVGVRPNISLLKDIGAKCDRAILVNEKSETSVKDIYSAGDCTQYKDIATGDIKVMALLPNAYMQGETAGINMAGGEAAFDKAIPMNAIGFFGYHIITAGDYIGESCISKDGDSYKRLFYKDDRLTGYIMIGDVKRAGIYTALIRNRTNLKTIDFELIKEKPQLMAFSKKKRREFLAK